MLAFSLHPETGGMIERLHRYLKKRFRLVCIEKELDFMERDDCNIYVSIIQFACNTTINRVTGCAPCTITSNEELSTPVDAQ